MEKIDLKKLKKEVWKIGILKLERRKFQKIVILKLKNNKSIR